MSIYRRSLVFTGRATALALVLAVPAYAQPQSEGTAVTQPATDPAAALPAEEYEDDGEAIVVTGVRRGTVIGDIPPENTLTSRDVRATGATDITELLEALAPQIGSARGRGGERPVLLLNGQRISSFREMRDIPTEAIERVDILPEEAALKYGYRADQRVVNIVLRPRFRSTVVQVEGGGATEGNYGRAELDIDRLMIGQNGRTMFSIDADANDALLEANRDIDLDPDEPGPDDRAFRTLNGSRRYVRGSATLNRQIFGDVSATFNGEVENNVGRSLVGLNEAALEPLVRNSTSNTAHLGAALNGDKGKWRWSATGNADLARSVTRTDRENQTERDRTRTFTSSADVDLTANGPLFKLPAGDASMTVRVGASTFNLDSERRDSDDTPELSRTRGSASANFDFPISRRNRDFSALGNLTLNANAEVEQFSDFGTLTTVGAGLNWSPVDRLSFLASWTREEGAPGVSQLGDPYLETPETRIFDFTTGETVLVTAITGGNPDLLADKRNVLKIGGNWKPLEETDLRLRAEYVRSRLDRPVSSFPGVSAALEAAFPDRFERDLVTNDLISVDFRPVNYDEARRDTFRWGFDFTKPLTSARPSQAAIGRLRARRAADTGQAGNQPARDTPSGPAPEGGPPPEGASPPPGGSGGGGGGFGRGGGGGGFGGRFGGGRQGGRLQLSVTHTVNLVDEVTIAPGIPKLDYLDGDAFGSAGGRSRHELEAQAGYFNNGLGARLSANWRSATRVDSTEGEELRFSSLATFNLRMFANLGERLDLVSKHPWLRGTSVRFEVNNLFNAKPEVRNSSGGVPFSYQPDLLDPIGRTVSISIRKLFLPPRGSFRRQQTQSQN